MKTLVTVFVALILSLVALGQSIPIKNPKLTGTMDVTGVTNKTNVRDTLLAQAAHTNLSALSSITNVANQLPYFNGTGFSLTGITAFGRSLLDDTNVTDAYLTLGLSDNIDPITRALVESGGEVSLYWDTCNLMDPGDNSISIEWDARLARVSTGQVAIDWQNRALLNSTGTTVLDWEIQGLRANPDGQISLRWSDRTLHNEGLLVMLDWSDNTGAREVKLGSDGGGTLRAAKIVGLTQPYQPRQERMEGLDGFTLRRTITSMTGVSSGISGASYNRRNNSLFIVRNVSGAAGTTYETTLDGTVLRTITNTNFIDTEAIEWVGAIKNAAGTTYDVLLVAEEDHTTGANESSLTLCLLEISATTLDRTATNGTDPDNTTVTTAYSGGTIANGGIEAIAYDPFRQTVYYTAEFRTQFGSSNTPYTSGPGQQFIWQRTITADATTLAFGSESALCSIIGLSTTAATGTLYNSGTPTTPYDIGDMAYNANADTILLLSDTGDRVVEIDRSGNPVNWLITTANQPEGLAINDSSTELWVVGEAQEFYRYGFANPVLTHLLTNTATLDFPSTLSTAVADLTVTVTGAAVGDPAVVSPQGTVTATASFFAWVSAANTVTVRFSPKATEDPASQVYRVNVFKN